MKRRESDIGLLAWVFKPWLAQYFERLYDSFEGDDRGYTWAGRAVVGSWLVFAHVLLKPRLAGMESWRLPLFFCPHINFSRPRFGDPLRLLIQLCWVLLVREQSGRRTGRAAHQSGGRSAFEEAAVQAGGCGASGYSPSGTSRPAAPAPIGWGWASTAWR